jgi:hypothetical protein
MKRTNYLASQAGTCPEPPLKKVRGRLRRSGALNNWFGSICFFCCARSFGYTFAAQRC